jgi:uncharacterized protein (TIGR02246 family)
LGCSTWKIVAAVFAVLAVSAGPLAAEPGSVPPLTAADREEIRALISRYSHAIDAGDSTAWLELFPEDGALVTPVGSPNGRAELLAWVNERLASRAENVQVRHFVLNTLIVPVSDGVARARSMLLYTRQDVLTPLSAQTLATGIYEDELRRTPAGWRFSKRTMEVAAPFDALYREGR